MSNQLKKPKKRKKGAEEAEAELRNEKVRDFVLDKAFVLMEKGLKDRGFIVERGSTSSSHLSLKCSRGEDGKYLASTSHVDWLHW